MKTISLKKVAVVAVASLGFGLLSVVPANATSRAVTLPTIANVSTTVGTATTIPVTFGTIAGNMDAACVLTFTLSAHTGLNIGTATSTGSTLTASNGWAFANSSGAIELTATSDYTGATKALTDGKVIGNLVVTPTLAGVYTGIVTTAATTNTGCAAPNPATTTFTLTVGTNTSIAALTGDGGTPTLNNAVVGVAGPANSISAELILPTTVSTTIRRLVKVSDGLSIDTATLTAATGGTQSGAVTAIATDKKSVTVESIQDGTAKTAHGRVALKIMTPTVGVHTITVFTSTNSGIYDATAAETVTVTVNAAVTSGTVAASTSTAFMNKNATITAATTEATAPLTTPASASNAQVPSVSIQVTLGRSNGAITSTTAVTASITGPGTLKMSANDTDPDSSEVATGRSISSTVATVGELFSVGVVPDGTAGVSTITITAGTYTVTKTVTFVGTVTALTFNKVIGSIVDTADGVATGDTDAYAGFITGKDSAGNAVTLAAGDFTAVTSAQNTTAVITNAAVVAATAGTYAKVVVAADAPTVVIDPTATKTGSKTLTLTHTATGLTVVATFTVGLAQATTVTLSLDKTTYTAGEAMVLTITALDAGGFAIGDSSTASFFTSAGIVGTASVGGASLAVTAPTFINGKSTLTLYAPLAGGPVNFSATTSTAATAPATAVTATAKATVTDASAALSTRIDSLNAKIVALTALIAKIMKSLKIK